MSSPRARSQAAQAEPPVALLPQERPSTGARLRRSLGRVRDNVHRLALSPTARAVLQRRLTYLTPRKLHNLESCARSLNRRQIPGDLIECGVALGGSAIVLASHLDSARHFHGYDVFDMIPPPSARDDERAHSRYDTIRSGRSSGIGTDPYYGYVRNLYDVAAGNLRDFGMEPGDRVQLHRGLFEETIRFAPGQRVALAHIDCDWHDPVSFCLYAVYDRLSPGGAIILDDYHDYGGCRSATEAFLEHHSDVELRSTSGNAVLVRRTYAN